MKSLLTSFALIVCFVFSAVAKEVALGDGSITFAVPDDFTELSRTEIKTKFPSVNAPEQVVGNAARSTTIAYQLKDAPVKIADLPDVKKAFTQVFDRVIPVIEWKENAIVELAGRKWVLMEMTSRAIDQDIHNIVLITSYRGRMLMFNFNSTKREFVEMEEVLRKSIKSIQLTPDEA